MWRGSAPALSEPPKAMRATAANVTNMAVECSSVLRYLICKQVTKLQELATGHRRPCSKPLWSGNSTKSYCIMDDSCCCCYTNNIQQIFSAGCPKFSTGNKVSRGGNKISSAEVKSFYSKKKALQKIKKALGT